MALGNASLANAPVIAALSSQLAQIRALKASQASSMSFVVGLSPAVGADLETDPISLTVTVNVAALVTTFLTNIETELVAALALLSLGDKNDRTHGSTNPQDRDLFGW